MADDYASHEDIKLIVQAVSDLTRATGEMVIRFDHQASLFKASEERREKEHDKMELEIKANRLSNEAIEKRLIPVEGTNKLISSENQIFCKIFGSVSLVHQLLCKIYFGKVDSTIKILLDFLFKPHWEK